MKNFDTNTTGEFGETLVVKEEVKKEKKPSEKDKKRGGFYWKEDKPYIAVTEILKVIDKPALRYWFGQQVYLAMVKDPTLDEKTALSAPYKISDTAKNRGTTVHSIVEAYKNVGEFEVGEEFQGYLNAFIQFLKDTNAKIIFQERAIFSEIYKYAGTCDILLEIADRRVLTDVKTGKDIYPEAFLQLSGYKQGLKEKDVKVDDLAVLLLNADGTYKFAYGKDKLKAFLSAKYLYEGLNEEKLKKLGYELPIGN